MEKPVLSKKNSINTATSKGEYMSKLPSPIFGKKKPSIGPQLPPMLIHKLPDTKKY
jgi:hypothetical protein